MQIDRQRQAGRAPRRLQHEQDRGDAEDDVERLRPRGAAHEIVGRHDRVADRRPARAAATTQSAGRGSLRAAEDDEGQQQRDGQERRPVDLRRERLEDPEDREQRQPGAEHGDEHAGEAFELAPGPLGLELLEDVFGAWSSLHRQSQVHGASSSVERHPLGRRRRACAARAGSPASAIVAKRAGWSGVITHPPPSRVRRAVERRSSRSPRRSARRRCRARSRRPWRGSAPRRAPGRPSGGR